MSLKDVILNTVVDKESLEKQFNEQEQWLEWFETLNRLKLNETQQDLIIKQQEHKNKIEETTIYDFNEITIGKLIQDYQTTSKHIKCVEQYLEEMDHNSN